MARCGTMVQTTSAPPAHALCHGPKMNAITHRAAAASAGLHGPAHPPLASPSLKVSLACAVQLAAPSRALGRRASAFEQLALSAALDAGEAWGGDLTALRSVFATHTADGEAVHAMLLAAATDPTSMSPLTFLRAVACTVAGNWAHRVSNRAPSTTMVAGPCTPGAALLEGATLALADDAPCLVVVTEIPPPVPLRMPDHARSPLATALILCPEGAGVGRQASLKTTPATTSRLEGDLAGLCRSLDLASGTRIALAAAPNLTLRVAVDGLP